MTICICHWSMDHQASRRNTRSMLSMGDDPGAFANSLKGICTVFVTSALAFASIKLVSLATLETPDPPLKALLLPCHLSISSIGKGPGLNVIIHVCCPYTNLAPAQSNLTYFTGFLPSPSVSVYGTLCTLMSLAETAYTPLIFAYLGTGSLHLVLSLCVHT